MDVRHLLKACIEYTLSAGERNFVAKPFIKHRREEGG